MSSSPLSPRDPLESLSRLARAERGALSALARREGLSAEDAVDCVQEGLRTLLDLAQTGRVSWDEEPAALLATIVRNLARNQRRRHFRARPHVSIDLEEPSATEQLPEALVLEAEQTVRLRSCVAELCEIQRAVVTLRLLEERPGEDVAVLLGITPNHAAVLLHRAKSSLRVCLTTAGV